MTITTDRGKTVEINYAWGPVRTTGELMIEIKADTRKISEIAKDFEDVQTFERKDENEGNMTFTGYTELRRITCEKETGTVLLVLGRRGNEKAEAKTT